MTRSCGSSTIERIQPELWSKSEGKNGTTSVGGLLESNPILLLIVGVRNRHASGLGQRHKVNLFTIHPHVLGEEYDGIASLRR